MALIIVPKWRRCNKPISKLCVMEEKNCLKCKRIFLFISSFVSVFSFKPLTKLSDAIGENQTADDSMNIIIAQEDENSNIEENRSMAPNIGSTQVIQSDIGSDGMR